MKHLFYLIYVLSYSGAVFISGMFIGQLLERIWSRREARIRAKRSAGLTGEAGAEARKAVELQVP